ncbi:MAG TPA: hypothetical protein VNN09_14805 [Candidatus Competibacteraceae bacterium]|nr:hypothetical protein [Candidatus Competibacteraceae bacterium]
MSIDRRFVAATVLAVSTVLGTVQAAATVTQESVTREALSAHPGSTVEKAKLEKVSGKEMWVVVLKGKDGKEMTLHYDPVTGKQVK